CGRDDEVGRLSRTFRDTFERLRTEMERVTLTDSRRREMVASVSHDLRTPLTALLGQLETIRMKGDTLSREQQLMLFERAANNAQHLKRLTDSLAELARLDSPDFETHPEPIAIGELVDDVVQRFASSAADAGLELVLDYPDGLPLTRVDAALVERALSNLIDNALRVTPRGGKVDVRVVADAEGVRVEVSDTGPGVAEEDQARVFDRFYQTSGHREHRGSSGLGLAIVRRVAELHGGKVGLRSEPGRGATFFIAIPQAV
ncbi:MAG: HAMP domain-containing histidine kinase, partial [Burkholderiaceae bacterium]|nr:HAMP domain-containing histidine kinase [Burkholderiaceae bacterium]